MSEKLRILFYNIDSAGVNYFRTQTPATQLEKSFSDKFYVEINSELNFKDPKTIDYLKSFNIIHYHRQLMPEVGKMKQLAKELREAGVVLIMDIDDYWYLHSKHPFYGTALQKKMHIPIMENLKIADYITTTTDLFASEIRKVTGKDNVHVFYNSVNPEWMKQFQNNWKPDPDGRVRITYMAGSSHWVDVQQLIGVMNVLSNDPELQDKFKVIIAGWDTEGKTTEINFNEEFAKELQEIGLWTYDVVKIINSTRGDVDAIPKLPQELKDKYRNNVFIENKRDIHSTESVYFTYEKILTNNHDMIKNMDYLEWLMNFERNLEYPDEGNFARRWTQKANAYAKVLDETDIVIAPLSDNTFNRMKSNLKQVECWTRKLPIVCSDIPPYNVHGRHMENCVLIPLKPSEKHAHKNWKKHLKKLILDADLRKRLGEQLHEDFKELYNLKNVTEKRAEFYMEACEKLQEKTVEKV